MRPGNQLENLADLNNKRFYHTLACLVGQKTTAYLRNDCQFEGLFESATLNPNLPNYKDWILLLGCAQQLPTETTLSGDIYDTVMIHSNNINYLTAKNCRTSFKSTKAKETEGFRTDAEISGQVAAEGIERELKPWEPSDDVSFGTEQYLENQEQVTPWNQFEFNAQHFNVKSTYQEDYYTTPLDLSKIPQYVRERADQIVGDINISHGGHQSDGEENEEENEEDKYAAVARPETTTSKPLPVKEPSLQSVKVPVRSVNKKSLPLNRDAIMYDLLKGSSRGALLQGGLKLSKAALLLRGSLLGKISYSKGQQLAAIVKSINALNLEPAGLRADEKDVDCDLAMSRQLVYTKPPITAIDRQHEKQGFIEALKRIDAKMRVINWKESAERHKKALADMYKVELSKNYDNTDAKHGDGSKASAVTLTDFQFFDKAPRYREKINKIILKNMLPNVINEDPKSVVPEWNGSIPAHIPRPMHYKEVLNHSATINVPEALSPTPDVTPNVSYQAAMVPSTGLVNMSYVNTEQTKDGNVIQNTEHNENQRAIVYSQDVAVVDSTLAPENTQNSYYLYQQQYLLNTVPDSYQSVPCSAMGAIPPGPNMGASGQYVIPPSVPQYPMTPAAIGHMFQGNTGMMPSHGDSASQRRSTQAFPHTFSNSIQSNNSIKKRDFSRKQHVASNEPFGPNTTAPVPTSRPGGPLQGSFYVFQKNVGVIPHAPFNYCNVPNYNLATPLQVGQAFHEDGSVTGGNQALNPNVSMNPSMQETQGGYFTNMDSLSMNKIEGMEEYMHQEMPNISNQQMQGDVVINGTKLNPSVMPPYPPPAMIPIAPPMSNAAAANIHAPRHMLNMPQNAPNAGPNFVFIPQGAVYAPQMVPANALNMKQGNIMQPYITPAQGQLPHHSQVQWHFVASGLPSHAASHQNMVSVQNSGSEEQLQIGAMSMNNETNESKQQKMKYDSTTTMPGANDVNSVNEQGSSQYPHMISGSTSATNMYSQAQSVSNGNYTQVNQAQTMPPIYSQSPPHPPLGGRNVHKQCIQQVPAQYINAPQYGVPPATPGGMIAIPFPPQMTYFSATPNPAINMQQQQGQGQMQ